MNNITNRFATLFAFALLLLGSAAPSTKAQVFDVSINTSSLSGNQILAFSLINGGGGVDNTVTLPDFAFGGGSPVPPVNYLGTTGVSGDLGTAVTMDDSVSLYGGTALFAEEFNPGTSLSFRLTTTNNFAGTTPDAFSMSVCDTSFNCYSDDPNTGAMLVLNLEGGTLTPSSFTLNGASAQGLPAPVVSEFSPTPEPPSLILMGTGLLMVCILWRKRGRVSQVRPA